MPLGVGSDDGSRVGDRVLLRGQAHQLHRRGHGRPGLHRALRLVRGRVVEPEAAAPRTAAPYGAGQHLAARARARLGLHGRAWSEPPGARLRGLRPGPARVAVAVRRAGACAEQRPAVAARALLTGPVPRSGGVSRRFWARRCVRGSRPAWTAREAHRTGRTSRPGRLTDSRAPWLREQRTKRHRQARASARPGRVANHPPPGPGSAPGRSRRWVSTSPIG